MEEENNQEVKEEEPVKKKFDRRIIVSKILKGSKILVLFGLFYTAIIMYRLGNFQEAVVIAFAATFFLILNKLESTWG